MRKVFEEKFLKRYKNKTPQEILHEEGRKALATIAYIRENSRRERMRLKAAEVLVKKAFPDQTITEHSGSIEIKAIEVRFVKPDSKGQG